MSSNDNCSQKITIKTVFPLDLRKGFLDYTYKHGSIAIKYKHNIIDSTNGMHFFLIVWGSLVYFVLKQLKNTFIKSFYLFISSRNIFFFINILGLCLTLILFVVENNVNIK